MTLEGFKIENGRRVPETLETISFTSDKTRDLIKDTKTGDISSDTFTPVPLLDSSFTLEKDPATVGGIVARYDASTITPQSDNTNLNTWPDDGPNSRDATAVVSDEPKYRTNVVGTNPGVYFDTLSSRMEANALLPDLDALTEFTMVCAFISEQRAPNSGDGSSAFGLADLVSVTDNSVNNTEMAIRYSYGFDSGGTQEDVTATAAARGINAGSGLFTSGVNLSSELPYMGTIVNTVGMTSAIDANPRNDTRYRVYVNDRVVGEDANQVLWSDITVKNKFIIGSWEDTGGASKGFKGYLFEIIIFNKALDQEEYVQVHNYLANKWSRPAIQEVAPQDFGNNLLFSLSSRLTPGFDGDVVHTIPDTSGNQHDFTQTSSSARPFYETTFSTYSVERNILFDGSSDFMESASLASEVQSLGDFTAVFIFEHEQDVGQHVVFAAVDDTNSLQNGYWLEFTRDGSTSQVKITSRDASGNSLLNTEGFPDIPELERNLYSPNDRLVCIVYRVSDTADADGDKMSIWYNGMKVAGQATRHSYSDNTVTFNNVGLFAVPGGTFTGNLEGHFVEAFMVDRSTTEAEVRGIYWYFVRKYYSEKFPNFAENTFHNMQLSPGTYRIRGRCDTSRDSNHNIILMEHANQNLSYSNIGSVNHATMLPFMMNKESTAAHLRGRFTVSDNAILTLTGICSTSDNDIAFGEAFRHDANIVDFQIEKEVDPVDPQLALHLVSDTGVNVNGSNHLTSWEDQSPRENDAVPDVVSANTLFVADDGNGNPVIRFSGTNNQIAFSQIVGARTIVWVIKEDSGATANNRSLLGDPSCFPLIHRGNTSGTPNKFILSDSFGTNLSKNSIYHISSSIVDPLATVVPTDLVVLIVELPVNFIGFSTFSNDRGNDANGRVWDGDLAELRVYTDPLDSNQISALVTELETKYSI